ncbi:MAG: GNAT family N-acetyltransferase [Defluviitaleaceae bacterium]|nr:GNAT family N-acetyltransferase [Defluviitaleaceae bacterium]
MKPLETERLILRKFQESDFEAVHSYAADRENCIYMFWGPNSEDETREFIKMVMSNASQSPIKHYSYAITLKSTGELIGGCDLPLSGDKEAEIGWLINRNFWRQGYAAEAARALLTLGFEELNLHRIFAKCDAENIASSRLMEKIGMRGEGLLFDVRPPHKNSSRPHSDELLYAIVKDEWEIQKEIAYYNTLPYEFNGFIEVPALSGGGIFLVCTKKSPANPEKKYVPEYRFAICKGGEKIGDITLRIGYGGGIYNSNLYYGGNIGYGVDEAYRGNGYASLACSLLAPVAKAHGITKVLITNHINNNASRRVCEKLNAQLIREVRLPEWTDLYKEGQRFVNIFEWNI